MSVTHCQLVLMRNHFYTGLHCRAQTVRKMTGMDLNRLNEAGAYLLLEIKIQLNEAGIMSDRWEIRVQICRRHNSDTRVGIRLSYV